MTTKKSFYITTPIYYVNDSPHIGHAYTTIACDVMARFKRLDGYDVKFLTGTDEHGQKVDKAAKNAGIDPQSFTDEVSKRFRTLVKCPDEENENLLNVTNNDFIRTTEERHKKAAQALWNRIKDNGYIYSDSYAGWYSVRDEAYYGEDELIEKDGKKLAPTGAEVEWVEEESYFFKLSAFQQKLLDFYEKNPDFITPKSRYNEVVSFVRGGKDFVEGALRDLSISRTTFNWGVPVPDDEKHVMYVWIDALTNYLTAIGFPDTDCKEYKKYWQNPEDSPVHVVGKDILRFHAVYWPAFLMAADLPLPKKIVAHGWWTIEGEKMSKSLGNVIAPKELIEQFGIDQTRYFLMREVPFGNDGNFSKDAMAERINSDLANNIGNLAQRTLSMIAKNCDGVVPEFKITDSDKELFFDLTHKHLDKYILHMNKLEFSHAIENLFALSSAANNYIDKQEPWKLKKEDPDRMATVLYVLAETIRIISIILQPFTPIAANKILDQLAIDKNERNFSNLNEKYALKPETPLPKPEGVFPRIENKQAA
ncbi:MAG: methionine--tRNA ligase [Rickettsiales bacterium]|nr:methionine--tRNA ligase [Pseudomonadota bacterium]MDA0966471.1 methionine--tRNA ligase [Pseudomonadota bacterium]MDG4543333.1 methionine--tRNA ligase [Rickettsiales bacterium]MDG4545599.1 methionine--tRNA ligase [Rickettsiales bacterium]MDG4548048.1 methionine--tRNA ligase [Rickettsiales bacterium]